MFDQNIILFIAAIVVALSIHEFAHALLAEYLGDPTARLKNRLTLNPLSHLDPIGSTIFLVTLLSGSSFVFGWGRPVPVDPYNLTHPKRDMGIIAIAGPISNFLTAIIISIITRLILHFEIMAMSSFIPFFIILISINITLGVFNLIPIPPLDGSKILTALLPNDLANQYNLVLNQYGFFILMIMLFFNLIHAITYPISYTLRMLLIP